MNANDAAKNWLADNQTTGGVPMVGGSVDGVGMFNNYSAIDAFWKDTTDMDNIRAGDITDHSIAGSLEEITRGGSTVHTNSTNCTLTTPCGGAVAVLAAPAACTAYQCFKPINHAGASHLN